MDNNNYQPQYQQPQYQQPQQSNLLPAEIQQSINAAFSKALAATIMAEFPIASIIAIFFGNNALKEVNSLIDICRSMGIRLPGKLVAARILALVGKIGGIVCTCIYAGLAAFYSLYFGIFFLALLGSGF